MSARFAGRPQTEQTSFWLLRLSGLSGAEFAEATATMLCLPSPACASQLGEKVKGQRTIDMFGDNVRAANQKGRSQGPGLQATPTGWNDGTVRGLQFVCKRNSAGWTGEDRKRKNEAVDGT